MLIILNMFHELLQEPTGSVTHSSLTAPSEVHTFSLIVKVRKLKNEEAEYFSQSHTANKGQGAPLMFVLQSTIADVCSSQKIEQAQEVSL